ncbi:hypothetical protein [Candidatus Protochlamydia phocaeensis]|uniref:hypothetical protein n=1 Tax=Candidatus Protochlamydia phocaeensis TaxID=1414722 RepID=UPI000A42CCBE|nr:hypothetical protein [Candidatus Protochlamydia phocaeensis]
MDILEKRAENQVQFWSLLGPFLILLSIAILLFKVSTHWYFPLSALIGIPLCVKWKMKGMAAALTSLFVLALIGYQSIELDERFWHVGMALAMAFSFIILTLSLEEVEGLVGKLQLESQSRLDNFLLLDEKMKLAEQEWNLEKDRLQTHMVALTQDLAQTQDDKQTFYKLVQLSKDELLQLRAQHDLLLQELFYKKQQLAQLNEKLEETEMTIQAFVNSDPEQAVQRLSDELTKMEQDKEILKAQAEVARNQIEGIKQELKDAREEKDKWLQDRLQMQEKEKLFLAEQSRHKRESGDLHSLLHSHQEKLAVLEQEKTLLQSSLGRLQQQYEYARQTENQHKLTIQGHMLKIEELQADLEAKNQEIRLVLQQKQELEKQQIHDEKTFKQLFDDLNSQLKRASDQIQNYQAQAARQNDEQLKWQKQLDAVTDKLTQAQTLLLERGEEISNKDLALLHSQQQIKDLRTELEKQQQQIEQAGIWKENCTEVCKELDQAKAMLQQKEEELARRDDRLREAQQQIEKAKADLEGQQKQLEQAQLWKKQLDQASEELIQARNEIGQQEKALYRSRQEIQHMAQHAEELKANLEAKIARYQEIENQLAANEQDKLQMEKELTHIKMQLEESRKQPAPSVQPEDVQAQAVNTRRLEGMYNQLKEQFGEKSQTLDETRKELFKAQEQLLALQKEWEELEFFATSDSELLWQKELNRLSCEHETIRKEYEEELEGLQSLVEALLQKKTSA